MDDSQHKIKVFIIFNDGNVESDTTDIDISEFILCIGKAFYFSKKSDMSLAIRNRDTKDIQTIVFHGLSDVINFLV